MLTEHEKAIVRLGAKTIRERIPEKASLDVMKQSFRMIFNDLNEEEYAEADAIITEVYNESMQ